MSQNSDYVVVRTKEVVLPFGCCSKVPELLDQEEELILIDAVKENKEIILVYKDLDGLSEFGCTARVSSYDYLNSFTYSVRSNYGPQQKYLKENDHTSLSVFSKSQLISILDRNNPDPKQFSNLNDVELLLLQTVKLSSDPVNHSAVIQNDIIESIDKDDLEKIFYILAENIDLDSIDCSHTLSFYTLSKILHQNNLRNNLLKLRFLKTNSENQRIKTLISLYDKGLLR